MFKCCHKGVTQPGFPWREQKVELWFIVFFISQSQGSVFCSLTKPSHQGDGVYMLITDILVRSWIFCISFFSWGTSLLKLNDSAMRYVKYRQYKWGSLLIRATGYEALALIMYTFGHVWLLSITVRIWKETKHEHGMWKGLSLPLGWQFTESWHEWICRRFISS